MCAMPSDLFMVSQPLPGLHTDACSSLGDRESITSLQPFDSSDGDITQFLKCHDLFLTIYVGVYVWFVLVCSAHRG